MFIILIFPNHFSRLCRSLEECITIAVTTELYYIDLINLLFRINLTLFKTRWDFFMFIIVLHWKSDQGSWSYNKLFVEELTSSVLANFMKTLNSNLFLLLTMRVIMSARCVVTWFFRKRGCANFVEILSNRTIYTITALEENAYQFAWLSDKSFITRKARNGYVLSGGAATSQLWGNRSGSSSFGCVELESVKNVLKIKLVIKSSFCSPYINHRGGRSVFLHGMHAFAAWYARARVEKFHGSLLSDLA